MVCTVSYIPGSIIWNLLGSALLSRRGRKMAPITTDLMIRRRHEKNPMKML
ncbi:hypothetical protein DPMN_137959 [Dreissena polymorpha]|uniref:Uncharacterized protein n=1 Tax=Dreissena polymorpha TaxID=45954 RepID=A0A9D4JE62_DREPO|nr:hypothetical protein DPMN_137959 [Dreissena polymorpha]